MLDNAHLPEPTSASEPEIERVGATFRNGSVTAIGVVLAFSLGFLNNWATIQAPWYPQDLGAVALIAGGIVFQILALARMLSIASMELPTYQRIVRIFLVGLFLVSLGVLLAIGGDALNYSRKLLKPA
jgi:hypothetical protein